MDRTRILRSKLEFIFKGNRLLEAKRRSGQGVEDER
jgi:hypothetical protein